MPPEFFSGLKTAATSPYALIAYVCLVVAWVFIATSGFRLRQISKIIMAVPEKDRAALLAKEYNTTPRKGLSAEQWIRSRKHLLLFLAFIALVVAISVVAVTAMLTPTKSTTLPSGPVVASPTPQQDLTGIQKTLEEINQNLARSGRPKISAAQMEAIKEVDEFIGEPDEMSLRREFGFPEMMDTNIRAIINNLKRYKRTGINSHYPLPSGDTLIDSRFAKGHIQRKGGGFQMDVDDTTVYFIMLPKDYVSSKARLLKMTNSAELPSAVIKSLKYFDSVIQQNSTHLIEVLSAAMDKDQNLYLEYDNPNSPMVHELDALYLDTFIQLRPEADKVRDALRNYLQNANLRPSSEQRAIVALSRNTMNDGIEIFKDPNAPQLGWLVNVSCKNIGSVVVARDVYCAEFARRIPAIGGVPPRSTLEATWREFSELLAASAKPQSVDLEPGRNSWGTVGLQMMDIDSDLNSGAKVILVGGAIFYSDEAGAHKNEFCMWAQPPFNPKDSTWHFCEIGHNKEVY